MLLYLQYIQQFHLGLEIESGKMVIVTIAALVSCHYFPRRNEFSLASISAGGPLKRTCGPRFPLREFPLFRVQRGERTNSPRRLLWHQTRHDDHCY